MHSIERYGIVALLFLVVTVAAVLMWDGGKEKGKKKPGAGLGPAPSAAVGTTPARSPDEDRRLSLLAGSQPGPLSRHPRAEASQQAGGPALPGTDPVGAGVAEPEPAREDPSSAPLQDAPHAPTAPRGEPLRDPVVGAAPAASSRAYTVLSGDTLSEIAERELGSSRRWRELVAANPGLDPARLRTGSQIRIPGAAGGGASTALASAPASQTRKAAESASAPKPAAGGKTWRVGPGESLWRIAERALGDGKRWREIAALNPKVDPGRLSAGTVLVLPAGASSSSPARTNPAPKRASSPPVLASRQGSERPARTGGRVR